MTDKACQKRNGKLMRDGSGHSSGFGNVKEPADAFFDTSRNAWILSRIQNERGALASDGRSCLRRSIMDDCLHASCAPALYHLHGSKCECDYLAWKDLKTEFANKNFGNWAKKGLQKQRWNSALFKALKGRPE